MLLLFYGRQVAYVNCKIAKAIQVTHCDCEKIIAEKNDTDKHDKLPASTANTGIPNEMFIPAKILAIPYCNIVILQKPTAFLPAFHMQSFSAKLLQPPKFI